MFAPDKVDFGVVFAGGATPCRSAELRNTTADIRTFDVTSKNVRVVDAALAKFAATPSFNGVLRALPGLSRVTLQPGEVRAVTVILTDATASLDGAVEVVCAASWTVQHVVCTWAPGHSQCSIEPQRATLPLALQSTNRVDLTVSNSQADQWVGHWRVYGNEGVAQVAVRINGEPASECVLDGNTSVRAHLDVTAHPQAKPGRYNIRVVCRSALDSSDLVFPLAVELAEEDAKLVAIEELAGGALSFGDVIRTQKVVRQFAVRNVTQADVLVSLRPTGVDDIGACSVAWRERQYDSDVVIPARGTTEVDVSFVPERHVQERENVSFALVLTATNKNAKQAERIECRAVLHECHLIVSSREVSFGNTQVGQQGHAEFTLQNPSQLSVTVELACYSKIIAVGGQPQSPDGKMRYRMTLQPNETTPVALRITPRRVNPRYRKQLTITNVQNRAEQIVVDLDSNNVVAERVHIQSFVCEELDWVQRRYVRASVTKSWLAVANVPLLRVFRLKNTDSVPTRFGFATTSSDIVMRAVSSDEALHAVLQAHNDVRDALEPASDVTCASFLQRLEELKRHIDQHLPHMADAALDADSERYFVVEICRKSDGLHRFTSKEDTLTITADSTPDPLYMRLSYKVCSTVLDLSDEQLNRNIGVLQTGEKRTMSIKISNPTQVPLYVSATKARKVSDLRFEDAGSSDKLLLAVRPLQTVQLGVVLIPSLRGSINETLHLCDVLRPEQSCDLSFRADVIRPDTLTVTPANITFEDMQLTREQRKHSAECKSVLSCSARVPRSFRMKATEWHMPRDDNVDIQLMLQVEVVKPSGLKNRVEEQIEEIEKKLKIYERKGKVEKLGRARRKLERLRARTAGETAEDSSDAESSDDEDVRQALNTNRLKLHGAQLEESLRRGLAIAQLGLGAQAHLTFTATARLHQEENAVRDFRAVLMVFDDYDEGSAKRLEVTGTVTCGAQDTPTMPTDKPESAAATSELAVLPTSNAILHHPLIDMGVIAVFDDAPCTFAIAASAATRFLILTPSRFGGIAGGCVEAKFKFGPSTSSIAAERPIDVSVTVTPQCLGPQLYVVPIQNLGHPGDMAHALVRFTAVLKEPMLHVPPVASFGVVAASLTDTATASQSVRLYNPTGQTVSVALEPSSRHMTVTVDGADEHVAQLSLAPRASQHVIVHWAFPPLPVAMRSRRVQGSLTVGVLTSTAGNLVPTNTYVVELKCTLTVPRITVDGATELDLGRLPIGRPCDARVRVQNMSDDLAVNYTVATGTDCACTAPTGRLSPCCTRDLGFTATSTLPGPRTYEVEVRNTATGRTDANVTFKCQWYDDSISVEASKLQHVPALVSPPAVDGDDWILQGSVASALTFPMRNNSALPATVRLSASAAPVAFSDARGEWAIALAPNSVVAGRCSVLTTALPLTLAQQAALLQGDTHTVTDDVHARVERRGEPPRDLFMTEVVLPVCCSRVSAPSTRIDLGVFGRTGETCQFNVALRNLAPVGTRLDVTCPPQLRLLQGTAIDVPAASDDTGDVLVPFEFSCTNVHDGPFSFPITLTNAYNTHNAISVAVAGVMTGSVWKFSSRRGEMHCDDDNDSATREPLVLPPVRCDPEAPITEQEVVSSAQLHMETSTDEASSALVTVEPNPDLEDLIELQLLNFGTSTLVSNTSFNVEPDAPKGFTVRCVRRAGVSARRIAEAVHAATAGSGDAALMWVGNVHFQGKTSRDECVRVVCTGGAVVTFSAKPTMLTITAGGDATTVEMRNHASEPLMLKAVLTAHSVLSVEPRLLEIDALGVGVFTVKAAMLRATDETFDNDGFVAHDEQLPDASVRVHVRVKPAAAVEPVAAPSRATAPSQLVESQANAEAAADRSTDSPKAVAPRVFFEKAVVAAGASLATLTLNIERAADASHLRVKLHSTFPAAVKYALKLHAPEGCAITASGTGVLEPDEPQRCTLNLACAELERRRSVEAYVRVTIGDGDVRVTKVVVVLATAPKSELHLGSIVGFGCTASRTQPLVNPAGQPTALAVRCTSCADGVLVHFAVGGNAYAGDVSATMPPKSSDDLHMWLQCVQRPAAERVTARVCVTLGAFEEEIELQAEWRAADLHMSVDGGDIAVKHVREDTASETSVASVSFGADVTVSPVVALGPGEASVLQWPHTSAPCCYVCNTSDGSLQRVGTGHVDAAVIEREAVAPIESSDLASMARAAALLFECRHRGLHALARLVLDGADAAAGNDQEYRALFTAAGRGDVRAAK